MTEISLSSSRKGTNPILIKNQYYFASIVIQRYWRGHNCRLKLWGYGGAIFVDRVINIQRVWRGFLGRKKTKMVWMEKINRAIHTIHSIFYFWKARRLRLKIHVTYMKKCVVKLQSGFRRREAKKLFNIVRAEMRKKKATKIQSCIRMFLGYRHSLRKKQIISLISHTYQHPHSLRQQDELQYLLDSMTNFSIFFNTIISILHDLFIKDEPFRCFQRCRLLLEFYHEHHHLIASSDQDVYKFCITSLVFINSMNSWAKYGRTRQIHNSLLENCAGILSIHIAKDLEIYQTHQTIHKLCKNKKYYWKEKYHFLEILEHFYLICSNHELTLLKTYDSLTLKSDLLLYFVSWWSIPRQTLETTMNNQPFDHESNFYLDCYSLINYFPFFHSSIGMTYEENHRKNEIERMINRSWKLLDRARNLIIPGSPDSFELNVKSETFASINMHPIVLKEITREYLITFPTADEISVPSSRIGSPEHPNHSTPLDGNSNSPNRVRSRYVREASVNITLSFVLSGSKLYVFGSVPSNKDIHTKNTISYGKQFFQLIESMYSYPVPITPCVLSALDIQDIVMNYKLFLTNHEYERLLKQKQTIEKVKQGFIRRLSSNYWLDYETFVDFLTTSLSLSPLQPIFLTHSFHHSDNPYSSLLNNIESPYLLQLPYLQTRRNQLLFSNDAKYASSLIQRIYRGYLGRTKFKLTYLKKLEIKRRRYLSFKIFYQLKRQYVKHCNMAIRIQSLIKGYLTRKQLRIKHQKAIIIQCLIRCFLARKKVLIEKERLFTGPKVISMLPKGGIMIKLNNFYLQLTILRCGNQYKFSANNILYNVIYNGHIYEKELRHLLSKYNYQIIHEKYHGNHNLLACKEDQINVWQYEKVVDYIITHLKLIPLISSLTNELTIQRNEHVIRNDKLILPFNKINVTKEIQPYRKSIKANNLFQMFQEMNSEENIQSLGQILLKETNLPPTYHNYYLIVTEDPNNIEYQTPFRQYGQSNNSKEEGLYKDKLLSKLLTTPFRNEPIPILPSIIAPAQKEIYQHPTLPILKREQADSIIEELKRQKTVSRNGKRNSMTTNSAKSSTRPSTKSGLLPSLSNSMSSSINKNSSMSFR